MTDGLPCLTIHQPYASLIAAGAKTIETRSRPTKHRGRLAIHAGLRPYTAADKHADRGLWLDVHDALGGLERNNGIYDLPYGAIVATVDVVDCLPILEPTDELAAEPPRPCVIPWGDTLTLYRDDSGEGEEIDHQLPFGDFRPGRYAHIYEDRKPTTERCPACWDRAWAEDRYCPTCDNTGRCDPIPAKGKQGIWRWTP